MRDQLLGSVLLVVDVVKALSNCPDKVLLLNDVQLTGSMLSSDSIIYEPLLALRNAMAMIAVHCLLGCTLWKMLYGRKWS